MSILHFRYEMQLSFDSMVTDHHFQFRCLPMETEDQKVRSLEYRIEPAGNVSERLDGFGNRVCSGEALAPHDYLNLQVKGTVETGVRESETAGSGNREEGMTAAVGSAEKTGRQETAEIPVPYLLYAVPSELTRPGKRLTEFYRKCRNVWEQGLDSQGLYPTFWERDPDSQGMCSTSRKQGLDNRGMYPTSWEKSGSENACGAENTCGAENIRGTKNICGTETFPEFLMHELYRGFSYVPGSTGVETTAEEALAGGKGVCQDYAQILIALCRMAGYPARYVVGLLPGEGATHAWTEVWQNGRWLGLDPTHDCRTDGRYIRLSQGRDFADCSVDRGCFKGSAAQRQKIYIKVEEEIV